MHTSIVIVRVSTKLPINIADCVVQFYEAAFGALCYVYRQAYNKHISNLSLGV